MYVMQARKAVPQSAVANAAYFRSIIRILTQCQALRYIWANLFLFRFGLKFFYIALCTSGPHSELAKLVPTASLRATLEGFNQVAQNTDIPKRMVMQHERLSRPNHRCWGTHLRGSTGLNKFAKPFPAHPTRSYLDASSNALILSLSDA